MTSRSTITIANWTYDPTFGRFLSNDGEEFFLEKRLNNLMSCLIDNRGSIVKRHDIIDFAWQDVQVNEENLTKGIFDLRKLLKQKGITEVEIETIRNIGYRLNFLKAEIPARSMKNWMLKSALYLFLFLSLVIMLIRAIRYDG